MAKKKKAKVGAKRKKKVGCSKAAFNVKGGTTAMTFDAKSCKG